MWEERLLVKAEAKKLLNTSAFYSSVATSLLVLLIGGYNFFDILFLTDIPVEALLVILCVPYQVKWVDLGWMSGAYQSKSIIPPAQLTG